MRVVVSPAVREDHPMIFQHLWSVAVEAQELDPDIHLHGLFVNAKRSRLLDHWAGNAWPEERTWDARRKMLWLHPSGRITMSIGTDLYDYDIARLFAHELRHIGQFHRCRYRTGFLGTDHMADEDVEPDAIAFEEELLSKMGLPEDYECEGYVSQVEFARRKAVESSR